MAALTAPRRERKLSERDSGAGQCSGGITRGLCKAGGKPLTFREK